ncbi:hypothetical protein AAHE18_06G112400 [Arachis hypogaea]
MTELSELQIIMKQHSLRFGCHLILNPKLRDPRFTDCLRELFKMNKEGKTIGIFDLRGLPVLCRLVGESSAAATAAAGGKSEASYEVKLEGCEILLICSERHTKDE